MASTLSWRLCCKIWTFDTLRSWLADSHALAKGPVALRSVPDQNMAATGVPGASEVVYRVQVNNIQL